MGGLLPVIKPAGPTSHDIVDIARRALGQRSVGHTGTLDPAATGVLVLCLGPYTKLVPYLIESDKTYDGTVLLGLETDTDDREGKVIAIQPGLGLSLEKVREAAKAFTGPIQQIPPRYAAVKVAGKKLYEYARAGEEVVVEPRDVTVHELEILALTPCACPDSILHRASLSDAAGETNGMAARLRDAGKAFWELRFRSRVSAGTYLRSLARDLGRQLGCGGTLSSLERTAVGRIDLSMCMEAEALRTNPSEAEDWLIRGSGALNSARYPVLTILRAYRDRILRGQPIMDKMLQEPGEAAPLESGAIVGLADDTGALLAVAQAERFEDQSRSNPYVSRHAVHFKTQRVFPDGLK
jgi:tRNA pseudouridine55 synthase